MNKEDLNRLKKYLFFVSMFFAFLLLSHIAYIYLYHDAGKIPVEGGTVNEGVIGDFPHLNPLKNSNDYNKNIIYLLYRGLLKYDYEQKIIVGDIANCDLSNLSLIECYINEDSKWSNGENITVDDIISTYNIIKNSEVNTFISGLLKNTEITKKNNVIIFNSTIKDINILNAFFQPIVSKEVIDNIGNKELFGDFNPMSGIYSGAYRIENIGYDDSLGINKLFLTKNEYYNKEKISITKYVYKFFKDINHLNQHKENLNIFFDLNNQISDFSPRINKEKYSSNQYLSLFLNIDKIKNNDIRNYILKNISRENILEEMGNSFNTVYNPFLNGELDTVKKDTEIDIEKILDLNGYFKKDILETKVLRKLDDDFIKNSQEEIKNNFISEGITGKYNFVNNHVLRLSGVTKDKEITDIHINNDRLNYPNGTPDFSYTLSLDNKNIKEGENKYDVFITKGGKKELLETFYVTYYDDREKINNLKKEYLLKNSKEEDIKEYNSKLKEIKEKLEKIDENFYYNENFYPYEIKFNYIDGRSDVLKTANIIKNQLEKYGIKVQKSSITAIDLQKKVTSNNKDYDMILIGIDLGVFNINLFPYFHSSQAKDLYNLSNIKDSELDDLLENLKNNLFKPDEIIEKQNKVIEKLKNYNIVKTIYNKSNYIYFDKNINNIDFKNPINNILSFYDKLKKANVVFQKEINLENKGIIDFFSFIKKLF